VVDFNHPAWKSISTISSIFRSLGFNSYGTFSTEENSERNFRGARVFLLLCVNEQKIANEELKFIAEKTGEKS
jgi:hypothetical protein